MLGTTEPGSRGAFGTPSGGNAGEYELPDRLSSCGTPPKHAKSVAEGARRLPAVPSAPASPCADPSRRLPSAVQNLVRTPVEGASAGYVPKSASFACVSKFATATGSSPVDGREGRSDRRWRANDQPNTVTFSAESSTWTCD